MPRFALALALLATAVLVPLFSRAQPAAEPLDLSMYGLIRAEGNEHSQIMKNASALLDGIGPRLTGSSNMRKANEWARDQLAGMGCVNAHLESWGEFGMAWRERNTWARMTSPDTAVLIARAAPWSPATQGAVAAPAMAVEIQDEKDFDRYHAKLEGKIVFLGKLADLGPISTPLFRRFDDKDLADFAKYPLVSPPAEQKKFSYAEYFGFREKLGRFLAAEKAAAVIVPSRNNPKNGASGGTIYIDSNDTFGWFVYRKEHAMQVPLAIMGLENYGRVWRLLKQGVSVSIQMNVDTEFTADHQEAFNTVAEIAGTDPKLKDQVVMIGAHLDSWTGATGATDNGAGTLVAMEVMRILNALNVHPRRTIRIALFSGEEQGQLGSRGYVKQHFGSVSTSSPPEEPAVPEFLQPARGVLTLKPEHADISVFFNLDMGSGRLRGITLTDNAALLPIFERWVAPLKDLGVTTVAIRSDCGSDCSSFDAVGIPAPAFIQDPLDYEFRSAHTNMDTYERLQAEDLRQAAIVEATLVYNAAMRDQMLPRKPLPNPRPPV